MTDPGIGFVTVTKVETSPDLARARVWVSVIGSDEKRKETLAALRRAMPFIRHGLGSKVRLRRIPELDVHLDDSIERGSRVLQILNELEAGQIPESLDQRGESLPNPVPRLRHQGDTDEEPVQLERGAVPPVKPGQRRHRHDGGRGADSTRLGSGKSATRRRPR